MITRPNRSLDKTYGPIRSSMNLPHSWLFSSTYTYIYVSRIFLADRLHLREALLPAKFRSSNFVYVLVVANRPLTVMLIFYIEFDLRATDSWNSINFISILCVHKRRINKSSRYSSSPENISANTRRENGGVEKKKSKSNLKLDRDSGGAGN